MEFNKEEYLKAMREQDFTGHAVQILEAMISGNFKPIDVFIIACDVMEYARAMLDENFVISKGFGLENKEEFNELLSGVIQARRIVASKQFLADQMPDEGGFLQ